MKLYPEIILAAKNNPETAGMIGGLKFYFVAKHYDRVGGSGLIHERDFRKYFYRTLGISRATYYRWKKQGRELGLFDDQGQILQLISWGKAARVVGCGRVEEVDVSLRRFVDNQGLSEVWAGYIKKYEPKKATDKAPAQKQKPITKPTLRKLTGIPESTQRYYEAKAGVKKDANIAHVASVSRTPELAITETGGGFYPKNGTWRQRLGNTYHAPKRIKKPKRGRRDKINRFIRATLSPMSGSDQTDKPGKLFFLPAIQEKSDPKNERVITRKISPDQQISKYLRTRLPRIDAQKRPERLYAYDRTCFEIGLWTAWDTETGVRA